MGHHSRTLDSWSSQGSLLMRPEGPPSTSLPSKPRKLEDPENSRLTGPSIVALLNYRWEGGGSANRAMLRAVKTAKIWENRV